MNIDSVPLSLIKFKYGKTDYISVSLLKTRDTILLWSMTCNIRFGKMNLYSVPLLLIKFKYGSNRSHLFPITLIKFKCGRHISQNYIFIITTTVYLALYKRAVHNNCKEGFLTQRWNVLGIMKWMYQSVRQGETVDK